MSGETPQAGEASAPKSDWSSSGLAIAAEQRADVGDLLLGPVAAAADDVGPQPGAGQRVLVGVEVGEGPQQDDHLAARDPLVGELAQALARKRDSAT